jgi:hypothetical protein
VPVGGVPDAIVGSLDFIRGLSNLRSLSFDFQPGEQGPYDVAGIVSKLTLLETLRAVAFLPQIFANSFFLGNYAKILKIGNLVAMRLSSNPATVDFAAVEVSAHHALSTLLRAQYNEIFSKFEDYVHSVRVSFIMKSAESHFRLIALHLCCD